MMQTVVVARLESFGVAFIIHSLRCSLYICTYISARLVILSGAVISAIISTLL